MICYKVVKGEFSGISLCHMSYFILLSECASTAHSAPRHIEKQACSQVYFQLTVHVRTACNICIVLSAV